MFPALLAGCLLACSLAGCAQCIGIQALPASDDAQGPGDSVQSATDAHGPGDAQGGGLPPGDRLVPSNGAMLSHLDGVIALHVQAGVTLTVSTDTGGIVSSKIGMIRSPGKGLRDGIGYFPLPRAPGGPDDTLGPAVIAVAALSVEPGGTLTATGTRPLLVLSRGDVSIRGSVSVSADGRSGLDNVPGAGGGMGAVYASDRAGGCAPGENGGENAGGGGGGFRHPGGKGGNSSAGAGGKGGSPADGGCAQERAILTGGSGGGTGAGEVGGKGGSGGGAVQITSLTGIEILGEPEAASASAVIWDPSLLTGVFASGSGGDGGGGGFSGSGGGGGGGSGGMILLEAPWIVIRDAYLTANGGGGGGGSAVMSEVRDGDDGIPEGSNAFGGQGDAWGGDGGTGMLMPTGGEGGSDHAGGGGGSAGVIRLHVPSDQHDLEQAELSPEPSLYEPVWE